VLSGGRKWWDAVAEPEPEEGDDRWGPPISQARRGAKAARGGVFLVKEAAIGQGATDAWPAGSDRPRGRGPMGRGRAASWGKEKGSGPRLGRKSELGPIQVISFFQFLFGIRIFGNFGNLYKEI
jgi:hypothetical protein